MKYLNHRLAKILGWLLFSVWTIPVSAAELPTSRPSEVGLSAERLARLDDFMSQAVIEGRMAGAVVLVARNGRLGHYEAYGQADPDENRAMLRDDLFRIYSMTKPVVSTALLMLYEEGHFQLDDPLEQYIPSFRGVQVFTGIDDDGTMILEEPERKPTIHDAFRHTLGVSAGGGPTAVDRLYEENDLLVNRISSLEQQMTKLGEMPLLYHPGERWQYGYGHDVQAYLVEHFSGMPLDEFLEERLFEPLAMNDTGFDSWRDTPERVVSIQGVSPEPPSNPAVDMRPDTYERFADIPMGTLGLWSTAMDYARFSQMLLNGGVLGDTRILGKKTVDLIAQNHLPEQVGTLAEYNNTPGIGYGLGVSVVLDAARAGNLASPGSFGWTGAATTRFIIDPEEALVAIVMVQKWPYDARLLQEFETLVYQAIIE